MQLEDVDPRDDDAFAAWFGVLDASLEAQRPGEPNWLPAELREIALRRWRPDPGEAGPLLLARLGGEAVGCARLTLPLRDNLQLAAMVLEVHPEARRRGVGSALLAQLVRRAREAGRTALTTEVDDLPGGVAADLFLRRQGFEVGLREARRDLALPVAPGLLDVLEERARPYAVGYELLTWRERTPGHLLADRARLSQAMSVEVPWGDVPHEEERWDAERVSTGETGAFGAGRTWVTAAAARDGRLVAFSDLGWSRRAPARAFQWSTLVLPEHRGRRLGLLLKVAALRELQAVSPATGLLSTWNALSNTPMIAVNEALGFRENGGLSIWSRRL